MKFKRLTGKADYYIMIGGNTMGDMSALDPKLMSPEALQNGYNWAMQQVNYYESIFNRLRGV